MTTAQTKQPVQQDRVREATTPAEFRPFWPGAHALDDGVRFVVISRYATAISVLLFDGPEADEPSDEIPIDPARGRFGDVWSLFVPGLRPGQCYLYRVQGEWAPARGLWFNPYRPAIDPYSLAITGSYDWHKGDPRAFDATSGLDTMAQGWELGGMPKSVVVDESFDWEGDRPLHRPLAETVIYEMHVRGLTRDPSAGVEHGGTFRGVIEKIPYLLDLGITAVELMPVQQFETHVSRSDPVTNEPLTNYWGYDPVGFFAPHAQYAADGRLGQQVREFKEMVKALHKAGIEVILDVVFNHTAEGNEYGPSLTFRALDNPIYYLLDPEEKRHYYNYSGTGNTVACNHPIVRTLIQDCLRYWALRMHVDGFRFDLASILGREAADGRVRVDAPMISRIAGDPLLQGTKIIAEAWDAGGAYLVGEFPGRWLEWNGKFRDDVRSFWRGDAGKAGDFATRLAGSSDLYDTVGRHPTNGINFVTSHDGFTLNDLVSYERKRNERNGEDNRDGDDWNHSANYGVEGPTDDPDILALRLRQAKNMMTTLLLSQGVPMLLMGDEVLRTQQGNNNAYCQDNEISWYDWRLHDEPRAATFRRFVKGLIGFRKHFGVFRRESFFDGQDHDGDGIADIEWYGPDGKPAVWEADERALGVLFNGKGLELGQEADERHLLVLVNARAETLRFALPNRPELPRTWRLSFDTARDMVPSPQLPEDAPVVPRDSWYHMSSRSIAVLISE